MTPDKEGRERRRSTRVWGRSPGQLTVLKGLRGASTIVCTIVNRSAGGALIRVPDASRVPDDFYLSYDEKPVQKMVCRVVRRNKQLVAVRYIWQPSADVRVMRLSD